MKTERIYELLKATVSHIDSFEDKMANEVLTRLGFTENELAQLRNEKVVMISFNYKGIKEERYVVSLEEIKQHEPEVYKALLLSDSWIDGGAVVANKTWSVKIANDKAELEAFLHPDEEENDDFYIEVITDDSFYSYFKRMTEN